MKIRFDELKNFIVYALKDNNTNEIVYIGCTLRPIQARMCGGYPFNTSNLYLEVVEVCTNEKEMFLSEEEYIKMLSPQFNIAIGRGTIQKGQHISVNTEFKKGMSIPKEWIDKRRDLGFFKFNEDQKARARENAKISSIKICGTLVKCSNGKQYPSLRSAARDLKLDKSLISAVCKGTYKQYKGYTFSYANAVENKENKSSLSPERIGAEPCKEYKAPKSARQSQD